MNLASSLIKDFEVNQSLINKDMTLSLLLNSKEAKNIKILMDEIANYS